MKKNIILLLISCFVMACGATKFSTTGEKEKQYINSFLTLMSKKGTDPDYNALMKYISPSYIKNNHIDLSKYKVDNYVIWGYSIESYSPKGVIVTKIWGKDREWVHELTFQLSKEKGKFYLVPSGYEDNYISPWSGKKTYLKE